MILSLARIMDLDIKKEIDKIQWFHRIDLGNGMITPGRDDSMAKLELLNFPADLTGKRVLDIGAADGFFSFESEKRGAVEVVAMDVYWRDYPESKKGFLLARNIFHSKVMDMDLDVIDLDTAKIGQFDLIIFLGVLYHLKYPLLALEKIASVCRNQLLLETHIDLLGIHRPAMAFYPDKELNHDPSNWCGPNPPAVIGMLQSAGFRKVDIIPTPGRFDKISMQYSNSLPHRLFRAIYKKFKNGISFRESFQQGRMIVHAWK